MSVVRGLMVTLGIRSDVGRLFMRKKYLTDDEHCINVGTKKRAWIASIVWQYGMELEF